MSNSNNAMKNQVFSLPELIRQQYRDLEPKTRTIFSFEEIFSIQRIILTGCGDSNAAAMAVKYIFEQMTGIPTEIVPAIELSRYYASKQLGFAPKNPLVIAVSNSGSVARIGEAIQRVVKEDAFALGITGNRNSLLGKSASRVLDLDIPPFEDAPGIRSYMVSVLTLLLLAIRLGEVRGQFTMDQANAYRMDLLKQADLLEELLPEIDTQIEQIAEIWKDFDAFDFSGVGNNYAAAWYGHAKTLEATGKYAMCVNAEEWLHLNFFMRNVEQIGTIVVCSGRNRGLVRVQEMIQHAKVDMKRPTLIITDTPDCFPYGAEIIKVPGTEYDHSGVLTEYAPCALLMGYICQKTGETYGRNCEGPWTFAQNGSGVKDSQIVLD